MTDEQPGPMPADPRQALKDALWGMGVTDDLAEAWITRWEAAAAAEGISPDDSEWWARAAAWIDEHRPAD